jgi:GT2 family glycosyltransferase
LSTQRDMDGAPVEVLEIELTEPLSPLSMHAQDGRRSYHGALCLVRLHQRPLGFVRVSSADGEASRREAPGASDRDEPAVGHLLGAEQLAERIWSELANPIRQHFREDGLPVPASLTQCGFGGRGTTRCGDDRAEVRAQAPVATVVVATRERPDSLSRCLESLLALDYPEYEIVVVDNAPQTSATRELLDREQFRGRVEYVREDLRGLAAAHNRGLAEAGGEFVAFTDDDVAVDRLWLLELARGFGMADRVACVTGLIVPAVLDTPAQLIAEELWGWGKGFSVRVFDQTSDGGDPLYPFTAGTFGSGANMAFDTAALRSLGGFDAATGAGTLARGGDDLSGFLSVISAGHRLVYNPAAFLRHAHHADREALRRQAYGYGVGLTAYLTKAVLDRPRRAIALGRAAGPGLARLRRLHADVQGDNSTDRRDRPSDLVWAERWGMVRGPAAYVRSRRRVRRTKLSSRS